MEQNCNQDTLICVVEYPRPYEGNHHDSQSVLRKLHRVERPAGDGTIDNQKYRQMPKSMQKANYETRFQCAVALLQSGLCKTPPAWFLAPGNQSGKNQHRGQIRCKKRRPLRNNILYGSGSKPDQRGGQINEWISKEKDQIPTDAYPPLTISTDECFHTCLAFEFISDQKCG